jgi:hypothetical protein
MSGFYWDRAASHPTKCAIAEIGAFIINRNAKRLNARAAVPLFGKSSGRDVWGAFSESQEALSWMAALQKMMKD